MSKKDVAKMKRKMLFSLKFYLQNQATKKLDKLEARKAKCEVEGHSKGCKEHKH